MVWLRYMYERCKYGGSEREDGRGCDDSIRATKSALEGGIVRGGGYALLSAEKLDIVTDNGDATAVRN